MTDTQQKPTSGKSDFEQAANEQSTGIVREFWDFLCNNKKWWMTPIIIVLLLVSILVMMSATSLAPFIYTMF